MSISVKIVVFWLVMLHSLLVAYHSYGGTYCLCLFWVEPKKVGKFWVKYGVRTGTVNQSHE
jgi:hypothetical protein